MNNHLIGRDATLSVKVDGEWVSVGTVGHMDYPKACVTGDISLAWTALLDTLRGGGVCVVAGQHLQKTKLEIIADMQAGTAALYDEYGEVHEHMFELIKPVAIMGKRLKPMLAKRSPKTNKLFDRWGRLK